MLEKQIKGFFAYCKVAGFKERSIETLSLRLNEFGKFLKSSRFKNIQAVTYAHLSAFVADYKSPSIHVKKARIWTLWRFFHFLTLQGYLKKNIATDLPYPKIEDTVPKFPTIEEYNRILLRCSSQASAPFGLRNLIIIMMLGSWGFEPVPLLQ